MLPKSWNDITVRQFQLLSELTPEDSIIEWKMDVIDLVSELDVDDMTFEEIEKAFESVKFLTKEPHKKYASTIGDYHVKPLKEIRIGEFLDLEMWCEDKVKNLTTIAAMFYRGKKVDEWGNEIFEPYRYDAVKRGELFYALPITSIYGLVENWITYRNKLINESYSDLFDSGSITQEELEELPPEEKAQVLKDEAEQKKFSRWGWEIVIDNFAQGDKTKYKDVFDLKLVFVLNQMSKDAAIK
jgi:hypothetical protein